MSLPTTQPSTPRSTGNWRHWPTKEKLRLRDHLRGKRSLTGRGVTEGRTETASFDEWLPQVTPQFSWDWPYLAYIREHLQRVTDGTSKRLMLFLPPRHGKSEMTTIRYPVWRMEREPGFRVCVGCYNQQFAERFGRRARRIARTRLNLSGDRQAAKEWETHDGGVFRACGVGNPPMGEGFDLIVIDDPIKSREEAGSEAYRERVWEWYSTDLYTRREPGCAIILIMTRWHEDDLAGRILASEDAGGWEVVNLPALAADGDPLGREPGEALCPQRFDEAALEETKRTLGDYSFEALYQQHPTPREGSFFRVSRLEIVPAAPAGLPAARAWDLGATAGEGDPTAGVKLLGPDAEGLFYVKHIAHGQWATDERDRNMKQTAALDGKGVRQRLPQDPGAAGKSLAVHQVRMLAGFSVVAKPISGDKETRADPFSSQVNAGNVRLVNDPAEPWDIRGFIEELRQFPLGTHDDRVDAASDAFDELTSRRRAVMY